MASNSIFLTTCLIAWLCADAWGTEPPRAANDPAKKPAIRVETADHRAREAVLGLLQSPKNQHYRKACRLRVPDRPTGLPSSYDIEVYGDTVGPELMQIRVRGEHVSGRWVDPDGVYYGNVPYPEIDDRVRQMVYFHLAEEEYLQAEALKPFGAGSTPPSFVIRLASRDSTDPFRLWTKAYYVCPYSEADISLSAIYEWNQDRPSDGPFRIAKQFGHNRLIKALGSYRDQKPAPDEPSEKTRQEVLSWLRLGSKETEGPLTPLTIDRKRVLLDLAMPLAKQHY